MSAPSFCKNTPNKVGKRINVSGENTLIKADCGVWPGWRVAIADEPIDAKADGKKMFCIRVDNVGVREEIMVGFTPMETFDWNKNAYFGGNGFTGAGILLFTGNLQYQVNKYRDIIDYKIAQEAKEVIVILTISKSGKKKEIRFLCDGNETKSTDVSQILKGDALFPAISLLWEKQTLGKHGGVLCSENLLGKTTSHNNPNLANRNSNSRNRKSHQGISRTTKKITKTSQK
jgi:hypothetical protein